MSTLYDAYISACKERFENRKRLGCCGFNNPSKRSCGEKYCQSYRYKTCKEDCTSCEETVDCVRCKKTDCDKCMHDMHYNINEKGQLSYNCEAITYRYVLSYLNTYASEMSYVFSLFANRAPSYFNNKIIISLGCGPASEYVGLVESLDRVGFMGSLSYIGYDANSTWENVQKILQQESSVQNPNYNVEFRNTILTPNDVVSTSILVLNYVLSDIYNHSNNPPVDLANFLKLQLVPIIMNLPKGSFVIVNEVNHTRLWFPEIIYWAKSLVQTFNFMSGYFDTDGETWRSHEGFSKKASSINLRFPRSDYNKAKSCKSCFFVLRKKV